MNENPEGTPNPLNPNPGMDQQPAMPVEPAQPAEPIAPAEPVEPVGPTPVKPAPQVVSPQPPNNRPLTMDTVVSESVISESLVEPIEPTQPAMPEQPGMAEPVVKDSIVEPVKKPKKKGAFIFAIILSLAAIGCAVAAILMVTVFNKKQDAVPAAISKLMSGDIPQYVTTNGNVNIVMDDAYVDTVSSLTINFSSSVDNESKTGSANAELVANFADGTDFSFEVDEINTEDGDLYLKLTGISEALQKLAETKEDIEEINCIDDESGMTNCGDVEIITSQEVASEALDTVSVLESLGLFEAIDGGWIRIPSSNFSGISDLGLTDNSTKCLIDAAGNLDKYGSNFAKSYDANQFIEYSTENLKVAKKNNDIYRLSINPDKFAGFINSMSNSGFMNEMLACTGGAAISTGEEVNGDTLAPILSFLPQMYVEINDNYDFTRVYLSLQNAMLPITATVDISISYPTAAVVVEEPEEYIDITDVLNIVLSQFYGVDITEYTE